MKLILSINIRVFSWSFIQYLKVSLPILSAIPYSVILKLQKDHKTISREMNSLTKGTVQKKNLLATPNLLRFVHSNTKSPNTQKLMLVSTFRTLTKGIILFSYVFTCTDILWIFTFQFVLKITFPTLCSKCRQTSSFSTTP